MIISLGHGLAFIADQIWKKKIYNLEKFMTEFQFQNKLDPGAKDRKKPV